MSVLDRPAVTRKSIPFPALRWLAAGVFAWAAISASAEANTLTITKSGSVHYDIRLQATASAIGPLGFPAQTSSDGDFQGTALTFPGFDSSLGTLTGAIWTLSGTYATDVYAGSTCISLLGIYCATTASTTEAFEAAVDIGDTADPVGPPGIPDPGGGPPLPAVLFGDVHRSGTVSTTVSGTGIIGCLIGSSCSSRRVFSAPFVDLVFDRSDPSLLAAYLAGPVNLGIGAKGIATLSVQCKLSLALATQCLGVGRSTATLSTTAMLTYVYTPQDVSPPAETPVPPAGFLFASGLGLIGVFRRRKTAKS